MMTARTNAHGDPTTAALCFAKLLNALRDIVAPLLEVRVFDQ
jgi:hypothetical protein